MFILVLLIEKENSSIRYEKVHSVKHTSLTFTQIKLCKRLEVNRDHLHFSYIYNSDVVFLVEKECS